MSGVDWLSPLGALVGLAAIPALIGLARAHRRGNAARRAIGLVALHSRELLRPAAIVIAIAGLVSLAAAQPAVRSERQTPVRAQVAAYVIVDTSRSMLARAGARAQSRLDQAKQAALEIRAELAGVPVGVASLTDRVLPHLFPSVDEASFARTLRLAVRAGQPPAEGGGTNTSSLASVATIGEQNLFLPSVRRRVAIVISDAESEPFDEDEFQRDARRDPGLTVEIVRVGTRRDVVYETNGLPEPQFHPDPHAGARASRLAALTGGHAYTRADASAAAHAARDALGTLVAPPTATRIVSDRTLLAPWLLALTGIPLVLVLLSKNLPPKARRRPTLATLSRARRRSSVG